MTGIHRATLAGLLLVALMPDNAAAQDGAKTYTDSRRKKIVFPAGDASFADEVVSFDVGKPAPRDPKWLAPKTTLGPPDWDPKTSLKIPASISLGCGGTLVVRFVDNALVDVPGPDLYVFEVGPAIEPTDLAISTDGVAWTPVGRIAGGTATVDIAAVAAPGDVFRYAKVTDLKRACGGPYPGADIDAIGAIGSAITLSFDAAVLFEFDKAVLRPAAQAALTSAAARLATFTGATVSIDGHTDDVGADAYNLKLSKARADAVRAFLAGKPGLGALTITTRGLGETRPLVPNDSDANRQKNRRVEIVIRQKN
jgi:OOP family OmpA-OmpF porin